MKFFFFVLFYFFSLSLWAGEKDFYIGDQIKLIVCSNSLTKSIFSEKLKDFYVDKIEKQEAGCWLVYFRSFETGKKEIEIGDKKIIFEIKSVLNEFERKDIFDIQDDIENAVEKPDFPFPLTILTAFLVVFGVVFILTRKKLKKESLKTAIDFFNEAIQKIQPEFFFEDLTLAFKIYVEKKFNVRILGKTSLEIIGEAYKIEQLKESREKLKKWLEGLRN